MHGGPGDENYNRGYEWCLAPPQNKKGTRVLISLWDSLMFGRVLKSHGNRKMTTVQIRMRACDF